VIFLTTGTQLPFDRLVRAVDEWLEGTASPPEVCAQVLPPARDAYVPRHFETVARFSPADYAEAFARADLIVSHAGMGTILTALTKGKRICIMPRQMQYGEHRNDHQLSTAQRLGDHPGLFTARDAHDLPACLDVALQADGAGQDSAVDPFADQGFTDRLRDFILTGRR
jgi:UDP-N-acetylglucosamine transferase subunit ALG13